MGSPVKMFDLSAISYFFAVKVWAALLGVYYILQLIWAWHSPSQKLEKQLGFVLVNKPLVE